MSVPNAPSPPETARARHVPDADLKAYADGELGGWARLHARRHLACCPACREEIERMERLSENLRAFEQAEPLSTALRARLIAAAANTPAATVSASVLALPPLWRRHPLLTLGASGAIAAAALYFVVLPRPTSAPEQQSASAETAGAAKSVPFDVAAALPPARPLPGAPAAAGPALLPAAPRTSAYAGKALSAPAPPRAVSAAAEATPAASSAPPRGALAANSERRRNGGALFSSRDKVALLKDKTDAVAARPTAARPAASAAGALRETASKPARPSVPAPLAAALPLPATPPRAVAPVSRDADAAATGIVDRNTLSYNRPAPKRFAAAPPREVVVAVARGRASATREAVVALVRSAGGSFEEMGRPNGEALGLDATARTDHRLDVRVAPNQVETLLADVARLNVQATPAPAKSSTGAPPALAQTRSVADANSGRGAAKPAPASVGVPAASNGNFGGGFGGGGTGLGRGQNNAAQNQTRAALSRREQRAAAVPAPPRAALTIRIVEEAKTAPAAPNNGAGRQSP